MEDGGCRGGRGRVGFRWRAGGRREGEEMEGEEDAVEEELVGGEEIGGRKGGIFDDPELEFGGGGGAFAGFRSRSFHSHLHFWVGGGGENGGGLKQGKRLCFFSRFECLNGRMGEFGNGGRV